MIKKIGNYVKGGLAGLVLTGAAFFSGCGTTSEGFDPLHQFLRYNEKKNMAPIAESVKIDYSKYDKTHRYDIIEDRAYSKDDVKPNATIEEVIEVSASKRYRIPALGNATAIEDANDGLILIYNSRMPAPDLMKTLQKYSEEMLRGITIDTSQNTLIFNGKKQAFGDFRNLRALLNEFDKLPKQIRIKSILVEWFHDITHNRAAMLKILKEKMNVFNLTLPSVIPTPDEEIKGAWTGLKTGANINLFYNQKFEKYDLDSAIKFLESYGRTRTLSEEDLLTSNGETVEFTNLTSIPYVELIEGIRIERETTKYRDIGTKVKMTPFANEEGFITLQVEETSGEHTGYYGALQRPTFREAVFKAKFTVINGLTHLAGTSIFTRNRSVKGGLPLLSSIPVLGELISSRALENSQSQLLYFVEARVIETGSPVGIVEIPTLETVELKDLKLNSDNEVEKE